MQKGIVLALVQFWTDKTISSVTNYKVFYFPFPDGSEPPSAGFRLPELEAAVTMWLSKQKTEF